LKVLVAAGTTVKVGQVVAELDSDATATSEPTAQQAPHVPQTAGPAINPIAGMPQARSKLSQGELDELAPAVRRMVQEHHVDPASIHGTGRDGRITKEDIVRHLSSAHTTAPAQEAPPAPAPAPKVVKSLPMAPPNAPSHGDRQTRTPMTPLRQRIAERLVAVKNETALLTTFNEVDMSRVMELRKTYRPGFKDQHGVDLGFMSFFVKAVVDALKTVPQVNAQIQGNEVVQNHFYDIGVAVGTDRGLVVPVVRDCDELSFAGLEKAIADLARKVREKTITLHELSGGVFTVSNGGIYGSLLSTPILNPPQSAILGMHSIKKRPVVVEDQIVIRPMMYLALSYDHRLVDGREAVTFLKRVVECIESPERMLLET
jgi:2-oxoglutarate dehydrogenase E2 component (dihydrolipoamide succinyltransferase)